MAKQELASNLTLRSTNARHALRFGEALAVALTAATALAYGLLTVQYALFTAAITVYAVLLADSLGEPALRAAGQRAGATALGITIAAAAFLLWSNPEKRRRRWRSRTRPGRFLGQPAKRRAKAAR